MNVPNGFVWGAATAAFQVEGAAHDEGRADSIWDTFCRVPGAVRGGDTGVVACDQYHRYPTDIALMKDLGIGAYRFSTSWARIRPDGATGPSGVNQAGIDYYSRLVDALLEAGIEPWVTLYHWDLPQALEDCGGWLNRDTASRFAEFALTVHAALGDRVKVFTTLNEPWCSAYLGYSGGQHAPGRMERDGGIRAAHHLLLAHGLATRALRETAPDATLAVTVNNTVVDPVDPSDPADVDAARRVDAQINRAILDPLLRGHYPADWLADLERVGLRPALDAVVKDGDLDVISTPFDALGTNYYHGSAVSAHPDPTGWHEPDPTDRPVAPTMPDHEGIYYHGRGLPRTDLGWEVQPEGLTRLLVRLHQEYTGPAGVALYVTENGAAYGDSPAADGHVHDARRVEYLDQHLRATLEAAAQGADVRGYFAWSLLDNFEWAWGYSQRFGIIYVDYATQERIVKDSALHYARIIAQE